MAGTSVAASLTIDDPVLETFAAEVEGSDRITMVGHRTRWDVGGPVEEPVREITAPKGIVAYSAEEMTVTVRAGTSVATLNEALAEAGQRCALPERGGTVGGAVAVGENDLLALGKGRLRDSVLQVRYVSAEGQLVTGGGPTVKNVTGFDLPRLMTGALGTLGFIAEVILRTNPIPAQSVWLSASDADPFAVYDALLKPSAVLWDGSKTWVLVEGHPVDVDAERRTLARMGSFGVADRVPVPPEHRWSLAPAELRSLGGGRDERLEGERPGDGLGDFVACVGVGTVYADHPQPVRRPDPVAQALARRVKEQFDPSGRLNPGREPGRR